jgi:cell division protein ZapA (FtsZ GTPase activity inhibitor)
MDKETKRFEGVLVPLLIVVNLAVTVWVGASYLNLRDDYASTKQKIADLEANIASRPPVRIVDFWATVRSLQLDDDSTPEELEDVMRNVKRATRELAEKGVLLLDRDAVVEAPATLLVPPSELIR